MLALLKGEKGEGGGTENAICYGAVIGTANKPLIFRNIQSINYLFLS